MNKINNNDIRLEIEKHEYKLSKEPEFIFTSVTTIINKFFEPFDEVKISTHLARWVEILTSSKGSKNLFIIVVTLVKINSGSFESLYSCFSISKRMSLLLILFIFYEFFPVLYQPLLPNLS